MTPSTTPASPDPYFDIHVSNLGHHWVLAVDQPKAKLILAGHMGPNPTTREGALKEIERFKQIVANATVKGE